MFLDNNIIKMNNNINFETIIIKIIEKYSFQKYNDIEILIRFLVKIINIHFKKYKLDSRVKREICINLLHRIDIRKSIYTQIVALLESNSDLQEMIYKEFYLTDTTQVDTCCIIQ